MTLRYVRSGAAGAATGADWANAYLTLAAAFTASAAGDTIYVSEDHAETQASSMTLTSVGTAANPVKAICVNHSGSVPPVSTDIRATATVTTTGVNAINISGTDTFTVFDGIIFSASSGGTASNLNLANSARMSVKFRNCALRIANTQNGGRINALNSARIELDNTTIQFGATGQTVSCACEFLWRNTSSAITGATLPTTLFTPGASTGGSIEIEGVDLSAIAGTIFGTVSSANATDIRLADCKINASATIASTPINRGAGKAEYVRLDSGGTNYKHGRIRYEGSQTQEATIVLSGGASDGTTPISWKIVTTANASEHFPYESLPIAIWNDTSGSSVTATLQGIWGGGSVPNNDDIWLDVEYLGDASSPKASFANNGKADILASNAALSAGAGTWGGSTTKFQLSVTFTPQQKGWIFARIKAAKASSTFYIDPKVTLT